MAPGSRTACLKDLAGSIAIGTVVFTLAAATLVGVGIFMGLCWLFTGIAYLIHPRKKGVRHENAPRHGNTTSNS